jgi:hypothetical protein
MTLGSGSESMSTWLASGSNDHCRDQRSAGGRRSPPPEHAAAARVLLQPRRRILSPFVLAELDYLITTHAGQSEELKLLNNVARGAYEFQSFSAQDRGRRHERDSTARRPLPRPG